MQKIADIRYAAAVLQWDQETYMPVKGAAARGMQIATLTELAHEQFTAADTGEILQELVQSANLDARQQRNVALSYEDFERTRKLPSAFVRQLSEATSLSFHAWIDARKKNSYAGFEKPLQDIIDLKKQEADYLGFEKHPYDALMNDYDRGLTVATVDNVFAGLKPRLTELLDWIGQQQEIDNAVLYQHFGKGDQWELGIEVLRQIGYDFEAGRQDISEHPFTTNFSSRDVRVTTRIDENDFSNMLWSCIHEGGHALYEQGLPAEEYGLPLGEYCSLSIHESQSRLWENCIGRGKSFWINNYALLEKYFPGKFNNCNFGQFYRAINKVQPSLIRTDADELTYHFHVMIRYEIEKLLIEGSIKASDIPATWNEFYKNYLGVTVPDDRRGCLQDVHWSHGSFGYFATYSIGSLYAAQFYAAIQAATPSLDKELVSGNSQPVLAWLRQHIYPFGRYYNSEDLCLKATMQPLNPDFFVHYATKKYKEIYAAI